MFDKVSKYLGESKDNISYGLYNSLKKEYPEQLKRVMDAPECELEPDFMGFVDTYEKLSYIIPLEAVVIDFGCYAAAQAYYFRNHRFYIGVDRYPVEYRFGFENTIHSEKSIQDFIADQHDVHSQFSIGVKEFFAISNYVPNNYGNQTDKLIKDTYQNCYIYYPGR